MRNAIRRWRFRRLLRRKRRERHWFLCNLFESSVLFRSTHAIARLDCCRFPAYVVMDIRNRLPRPRGQFSSFDQALARMDELLDNKCLEGHIQPIPEYFPRLGYGIDCGVNTAS
jgi:hypothetical protein